MQDIIQVILKKIIICLSTFLTLHFCTSDKNTKTILSPMYCLPRALWYKISQPQPCNMYENKGKMENQPIE